MTEKLTEYARRGSIISIYKKNLQKAAEKNLFEGKTVLRDTLQTVRENLFVKKKGNNITRHQPGYSVE